MMSPIQLLFILVSLFILVIMLIQFQKNMLNFRQYVSWSLIWVALLLITLFTSQFSNISNFFGVDRFVDLIIYLSIIALFVYMYNLHMKVEKTNREITKLVRDSAIKSAKKK